jgi:peroxiredoxin
MRVQLARRRLLGAAFILFAVACAVGADDSATGSLIPVAARTTAPDFSSIAADGARVTLSRYRGRVVLLDFWATWCTGCKTEIPWYVDFQKRYAARGLRTIGVAMDDEGWQQVKPYLDEHPIDYPIVLGQPDVAKLYRIGNLPVTLLIDRQGRIADAHVGVVVKATWEREIQRLLKG